MVKINCPQLNKTINADTNKSLMENLLDHQIPVASSCGGDGICGKCKVTIASTESPPASDLEKNTLSKNGASPGERLSCQFFPITPIQVKTTYW